MTFTRIFGWLLIAGVSVLLMIGAFTGSELSTPQSILLAGQIITGAILVK